MENTKKAKTILLIEKLRLVESELFRLSAKYGVKTLDELDDFIEKGKLSEETVGEDLFVFDTLLSEKKELEKDLNTLNVSKNKIWTSFQNLLELPRLSFRK